MSLSITKFHWIRHAPVKAMMPGRIYGQRDVGCKLNDTERLLSLADQLPKEGIWVSSSLSRTKKTAKAIGEQKGWKVRPLAYKELMEQNFGLWQSKTWDELEDDPAGDAFWKDPAATCPPDGESFEQLCTRVQKCINHLIKKYNGQEIICVAHAGTIRAALAQALDMTPASALRLKIDTLSLSQISHFSDPDKDNTWSVERVNF
ncbi:Phosphoglycerate/bisphosphoglycerate mutase [Candidatus Terasakiella magnetica]|uniref:Phosphoglycerate/bisphosphoglycerate mutase n=1 Tax=Candidatus Terasakiella magnetica TaxID=1867952 RepID=A0A1C3REU6_9PROT|nr:histidine phosphatase family protein [Candidatus Terasakiella magnetica]SCA55813.1 Phosphoglycerate/bisphosphoglycerate mutase [Candidatus Terasakiella magnetica]